MFSVLSELYWQWLQFFRRSLAVVARFPGFLRRSRHPVSSSSDTFTSIQSMGADTKCTDTLRWSTDLIRIIGLEGKKIYKISKRNAVFIDLPWDDRLHGRSGRELKHQCTGSLLTWDQHWCRTQLAKPTTWQPCWIPAVLESQVKPWLCSGCVHFMRALLIRRLLSSKYFCLLYHQMFQCMPVWTLHPEHPPLHTTPLYQL